MCAFQPPPAGARAPRTAAGPSLLGRVPLPARRRLRRGRRQRLWRVHKPVLNCGRRDTAPPGSNHRRGDGRAAGGPAFGCSGAAHPNCLCPRPRHTRHPTLQASSNTFTSAAGVAARGPRSIGGLPGPLRGTCTCKAAAALLRPRARGTWVLAVAQLAGCRPRCSLRDGARNGCRAILQSLEIPAGRCRVGC